MTEKTNIPKGYKNSPLGMIPKEWEVKRLGDCTRLLTNGFVGVATPHYTEDPDGITYIQGFNVTEGGYNLTGIKKVTKEFHKKNSKSSLQDGDLLTIQTGDIGLTTIVPKELEGSNCHALIISRFKEGVLPRFMLYYYNSTIGRHRFHIIETGSTMKHINTGDLFKFYVPVPPIEEQNKIVEIADLWDTAIEKQSELIKKLKLRKRALMQQLLTGKKRLPGFSGEWKRIKLGDIAERITRKNEEGNKNVVTISAQRGFVVQTDFFNKSVASEVLDNYFLVYKDEFCYNKSYSNGYPMGAIKRLKSFDKAVVTTLYICFKLKNMASVNIDFFEQYCESGIFNKELVKVANEGGRAHGLLNVTPTDFFNMHMRIPNIDEQNAIAILLVNANKEIELANEKLASLQSQKRGLMQQLLTGKKRIMTLKEEIVKKTKEIETEIFQVEEVSSVPTISNSKLTFGCKGLEFEATVLYIDMRGSTAILNKHQKRVVAKIHMLYYHAIVKIAKATGGEIRSFNGDSLLVFYQGTTKRTLSDAVKAAMQMKYAIKTLLNENLKNYTDIDFGIGIDDGKILATKVGIGGTDETKDLIWIGNPVNKSTKISDQCASNYNVGISSYVYNNLLDDVKYHIDDNGSKNDMWNSCNFIYNGKTEIYYKTSYYWTI